MLEILLETILKDDLELSDHLAKDAEIVEKVEFVRAVVKIAKGLILAPDRRAATAVEVIMCKSCCSKQQWQAGLSIFV